MLFELWPKIYLHYYFYHIRFFKFTIYGSSNTRERSRCLKCTHAHTHTLSSRCSSKKDSRTFVNFFHNLLHRAVFSISPLYLTIDDCIFHFIFQPVFAACYRISMWRAFGQYYQQWWTHTKLVNILKGNLKSYIYRIRCLSQTCPSSFKFPWEA